MSVLLILPLIYRLCNVWRQKYQVDILSATPKRLRELLEANKVSLECMRHFAMDEVDKMLETTYLPQFREIEERMPPKENRQTILFSATMPENIERVAAEFLLDFVSVKIKPANSQRAWITQTVKFVEETQKQECLMQDIVDVKGKIIGILY